MTESSSEPPDIESTRPGATPNPHGLSGAGDSTRPRGNPSPLNEKAPATASNDSSAITVAEPASTPFPLATSIAASRTFPLSSSSGGGAAHRHGGGNDFGGNEKLHGGPSPGSVVPPARLPLSPAAPAAQDQAQGAVVEGEDGNGEKKKKQRTFVQELKRSSWIVATHSWGNVLLVFVPVGIIVANVGGLSGGIVFAMNCVAIIPLAGLLAFATECVATSMGDALGALLNVTFGNAVELIIFIALVKNEIRIVQASLLGSILANLLLILGMCFFFGGMRFREQIYNSTVTQMSACLLSLSVTSLVLPTAFYASFQNQALAQDRSLKVSRGTSVILLLVYVIYLLFQLKSHAYMYESTPQHIVDAESTPGPAAGWLDSSSDSSSSSSDDSDSSGRSHDTVRRRMKKVLRAGRRRKSSVASVDTADMNFPRSSSFTGANGTSPDETVSETSSSRRHTSARDQSGDANEVTLEDEKSPRHSKKPRFHRRRHSKQKKKARRELNADDLQSPINDGPETGNDALFGGDTRRVDFAVQREEIPAPENGSETRSPSRRPFPTLRGMSVRNLAPTVFVQKPEGASGAPAARARPVPRVRYGIRRTNSLPDRLNDEHQIRPPGAMFPAQIPLRSLSNGPVTAADAEDEEDDQLLSRNASIVLLLVSTALVAVCAEFLVGSIQEVVSSSSVGEIFIGLIILPIVGNAAEHVTALTVAMKNKMDLAIGVAVGSSIQIAIFVTPLVVILGWIIDKPMTLHFTLFETVCLFVSAFIVNFLVLDGRSNYLEGALLCAVYLIIAIVAFFYPDADQASLT